MHSTLGRLGRSVTTATFAIALLSSALALLAGPKALEPSSRRTLSIRVSIDNYASPGVPIELRLRDANGHLLHTARTDSSGVAELSLPSEVIEQARELQALLFIAKDSYIGTVHSMNPATDAYCLFLPSYGTDCLNARIVK